MQKLHLVGVTTDHDGLILSARRGARSGSYHVAVDDTLVQAVEDLLARRAEAAAEVEDEPAAPSRPDRVESRLPVRDIQARLRQGRSINEVAKAAGVDPSWVERFADPVFAEMAQVIAKVQGARLKRPRLGASALPIGEAVQQHVAARGVALTSDELASSWTTRQLADGRWVVRVAYRSRSKEQRLRFDLDDATGEVLPADRISAQHGYVAPPPVPGASPPAPRSSATGGRPTAKRATVTTGFRPENVAKAVSPAARERERAAAAMRKAAAKRAVETERAAARRAKEKAAALVRREREARAEAARKERESKADAARKERERLAKERATQRAERAKAEARERAAAARAKAKAEKQAAAQARRAEAALAAAEKAKAAESAERARAEKAASRRAAAAAAKQAPVKQTPVKQTPVKAAAVRPAAKKAPPKPAARQAFPMPTARPPAPVLTPRLPVSRPTPRPAPKPRPVADPDLQPPPVVTSPADGVHGSAAARALFRAGLAEQTSIAPEPAAPVPSVDVTGNGSRRDAEPPAAPPIDRPRRTRPLRAT